jgi:hypothetical protein
MVPASSAQAMVFSVTVVISLSGVRLERAELARPRAV